MLIDKDPDASLGWFANVACCSCDPSAPGSAQQHEGVGSGESSPYATTLIRTNPILGLQWVFITKMDRL